MKTIKAVELKKKFENKESFVLLDVREEHELLYAKISSSVNIAMSSIVEKYSELDLEVPIVVMCHTGVRSFQVCQYLEPLGFNVANLEGGIEGWSTLVDPTIPRY
jgi:rhodanese-related sulfurtransferase